MSVRIRLSKSLMSLSLACLLMGATQCGSTDFSDPQACAGWSAERMARYTAARDSLEPWHQELVSARASRGLASAPASGSSSKTPVPEPYLSDYDRDGWTRWAREQLVEVSNTIDVLPLTAELRPARAELSSLAQELVQFHGSAERGLVSRMLAALDEMKARSKRAAAIVCKTPKR